jgi:hypothetical protein
MAYEAEKNRLADLITATVGITRIRDSDLEREATERAYEARLQTGLNIGDADGPDNILHPPREIRAERLAIPLTVYTAELATWNYLIVSDNVGRAATGLLNSEDHRAVLDSVLYKYWGIGIYTEMPAGETSETFRRWYFIIWLANKPIGTAAMTQPTELVSKKISFATGTHYAYKFGYDGRILETKSITLASSSQALASGRGRVPNRAGVWLYVANGAFAGFWVQEDYFATIPHAKLT